MHGERDILHQFVFPELKRRARYMGIELIPIDLRWGILDPCITGLSSNSNGIGVANNYLLKNVNPRHQVEACLNNIDRSSIFIGLLGERYGWKPVLKDHITSKLEKRMRLIGNLSLEEVLEGSVSITEVEMRYAMAKKEAYKGNDCPLFFFIRNSKLDEVKLSDKQRLTIFSSSKKDAEKLKRLKNDVTSSVFHSEIYHANLKKNPNDTHCVEFDDLGIFGKRIIETLWNHIKDISKKKTPNKEMNKTKKTHFDQEVFAKTRADEFLGRKKLVESLTKIILGACKKGRIVNVAATKQGVGMTSILSKVYTHIRATKSVHVIPYFYLENKEDAMLKGQGENLGFVEMLKYLYKMLNDVLGIASDDHKSSTSTCTETELSTVCKNLAALLQNCNNVSQNSDVKIIVFVDGLEYFQKAYLEKINNNRHILSTTNIASGFLQWLPENLPQNVSVVISTNHNSNINKLLSSNFSGEIETASVGLLDYSDRKTIARSLLKENGKELNESNFDNQLGTLIAKRDAGNVRYLKLLCQEMASFGIYTQLQGKLKSVGETSEELLDEMISKAENDIGAALVHDSLHILLATEGLGMSQSTLEASLDQLQHSHRRGKGCTRKSMISNIPINPLNIAVLLNCLEEFFKPSQGSLSEGLLVLKRGLHFQRARARCHQSKNICECVEAKSLHRLLSQIFLSMYKGYPQGTNIHPYILQSMSYHFVASDDIEALEKFMCSLAFIQQCAASGPHLLRSLQALLSTGASFQTEKCRSKFLASTKVRAYSRFLQLNQDVILSEPSLLIQYALKEPNASIINEEAVQIMSSKFGYCYTNRPKLLTWHENSNHSRDYVRLMSSRRIGSGIKVTSAAAEDTASSIILEHLLSAHGLFDGRIIVSLSSSNTELFQLIAVGGSPIRYCHIQLVDK